MEIYYSQPNFYDRMSQYYSDINKPLPDIYNDIKKYENESLNYKSPLKCSNIKQSSVWSRKNCTHNSRSNSSKGNSIFKSRRKIIKRSDTGIDDEYDLVSRNSDSL